MKSEDIFLTSLIIAAALVASTFAMANCAARVTEAESAFKKAAITAGICQNSLGQWRDRCRP